jgi:hypothetical protein
VQAVYYRDRNCVEPVNEFIDALAPERQEELAPLAMKMMHRAG